MELLLICRALKPLSNARSYFTFEIRDHTDSILRSGSNYHTFSKISCLSVVLGICKSFTIVLSVISPYSVCGKVKVTCGDPYSGFVSIQSVRTLNAKNAKVHTHPELWAAILGSVPCSRAWYLGWRQRCTFTPPPTIPAGPETRTHDLWVTSPTL